MILSFALVLSATALKVLAPSDMKGAISHTAASFGSPNYGGSITGQLFYWKSAHLGCKPLDRSLIPENHRGRTIVVMLDRGNCTFVQKVRDAEDIAANAVIIVNSDDELVTMADDGTGRNIGVPSVLISKSEGAKLEAAVNSGKQIMVEMSWDMPHPDNHVEWELWTSSDDMRAASFVSNFIAPALALGKSVSFTPNYGILDGSWYGCDTAGLPCGRQCTNGGRYCAEDPDNDITHGTDGLAVVQENLRQICLFQQANATQKPELWWQYVTEFAACTGKGHLTEACSTQTMKLVGADASLVAQCVADAGGSDYEGGVNTLLAAQLARTDQVGVAILPSIRINDKDYKGSLDCPEPIHLGTCPVLSAICSGFQSHSAPAVCRTNYCWGKVDACGVCNGDGSTCAGCDGVPNSGKKFDACSVCGGSGSFDKCGMCLPANHSFRDFSCAGCDGVPNSGKVNDACGVCGGDGSTDMCGNCFAANSPQRNKACADTISVSIELTGMDGIGLLKVERELESGIAKLLFPNVSSAEDVRVVSIISHLAGGGSSTINITSSGSTDNSDNGTSTSTSTKTDRVTVQLEVAAHPGTGQATSEQLQQSVHNGAFDREMHARHMSVTVDIHDDLPAPIVRAGTPAASVSFVPTPSKDNHGDSSLATAQIAGIAVAGVVALALFGVGVRRFVVQREDRVRMDMRNLISDMGRPMAEVSNPAQSANVDFSSL